MLNSSAGDFGFGFLVLVLVIFSSPTGAGDFGF